jgi:hypothetical protein
MAGNHAIIAPSSLALTVKCNGWIQLARSMDPALYAKMTEDTDATREGNAADWVVKQYAQGNEVPHGTPIPLPGGYSVDYDMIHGAKMWLDVIGYGSVSGVPVIIERVHPTDCWGEPDGWRWDAIEGVLRLPDYKYGFDVVEVYENFQLGAYAAGIMTTLGLHDEDVTIEFTIVQPRAFHPDGPVRRWRVNGADIRALVNTAWNAAVRAWPVPNVGVPMEPPMTIAGTHCIHCPARIICKTYQQAVTHLLEWSARAAHITQTPEDIGTELVLVEDAMEILKGRKTALETQAETLLRGGKRVSNFAMEPGQSRESWNEGVSPEELLALGDLIQKDLRKPLSLFHSVVTPTQARKAGIDGAVIDQYASRPRTLKMVRESTIAAQRAFGAIKA